LSKRILSQKGTEQWHAQAHYLLGRNKESVGDIAGAIEEYKFEASGQSAGNRLRVRRLESGLDPAAAAKVNQ
jgi:N-glycosylase/DNA lyase